MGGGLVVGLSHRGAARFGFLLATLISVRRLVPRLRRRLLTLLPRHLSILAAPARCRRELGEAASSRGYTMFVSVDASATRSATAVCS
jgi:hypothetical protein